MRLTQVLKVNTNLMHATCQRLAENDTRCAIEAELFELGGAIFALWRHLTYANLVADDFDGFLAFDDAAVG